MSGFEPEPTSNPSTAPPTQPGVVAEAGQRTSWPTVLGIVAIVFGVFGVLGGLWGLVAVRVMASAWSSNPAMEPAAEMADTPGMAAWTLIGSLLNIAFAVLLLVAGIGLISRRRWARSATFTWAVLKPVLVLVSVVIGLALQREMFERMGAADANRPAFNVQATQAITGFSMCLGLVWGWALPVFMLIWMLRARIREEMATWR